MAVQILSTDPLDIMLGADGDIVITSQGLQFISGPAGVAQLIRIGVLLFLGEWFLNLNAGIPWWQTILGEGYDERAAHDALYNFLVTVPGVNSVDSVILTFDPTTRALTIAINVTIAFADTSPDTLALSVVMMAPPNS